MQTLIARDEYSGIEERFWKRGRILIGLVFGVVMCSTSIIQQAPVLGFGLALSVGLVFGTLTGIGFGWLWAWAMSRSSRKLFNRAYEGDPAVLGEIPPEGQYSFRLPCKKFVTNNVTIGGILYLGQRGARFVPHKRFRSEQPVELTSDRLVVWAVDWKPSSWGRTFVASGPRVLELGSADQKHRFAFPDPDVVVPRIREALGQ